MSGKVRAGGWLLGESAGMRGRAACRARDLEGTGPRVLVIMWSGFLRQRGVCRWDHPPATTSPATSLAEDLDIAAAAARTITYAPAASFLAMTAHSRFPRIKARSRAPDSFFSSQPLFLVRWRSDCC